MLAASLALAALGVFAAGCGEPTVRVEPPHPTGAAEAACRRLFAALPAQVLGESARVVQPASANAAAWGDPPILLRCGVHRPAKLRTSSDCLAIDHVGWFSERATRGYIFTTIGRDAYVELSVPSAYQPPSNALVDVAAAVRQAVPVRTPCV
ncbi:Protein of unknown function [Actinopolymorpha cephalotaxi]|uniref:DUF3515 domain-containing protein n=1 Tax=Actinopolymorpha cephalotaxi TaxID=504797 RepID=A0A1I3AKA7_9ACTN|nr:DUF3515 domain-containing protein [Actinopolymorpha cephalotaxi]NYH82191.1 hypothetical protein [Actinopolymorpha cephalotaxi]SFH50236.1 Protein of unknown function [Actinopolymorpha cephalotaxi]